MRRLRRVAFNGLCAVSTLLCVGLVVLWARSFWGDSSLLSRRTESGRYTLATVGRDLVLRGPPVGGADDLVGREIASRASNDDFDWQPPMPGKWEGRICA